MQLATRELPRESWAKYLDEVSVELRNVPVTVEVVNPGKRPAIAARRMVLQAVAYDHRDDIFEVVAARGGPHLPTVVRHVVDHPRRIEVDSLDSPAALIPGLIEVLGRDGVLTIVRLAAESTISE